MNDTHEKPYTYEEIEAIAHHLLGKTKHRPLVGVVCGSGLGALCDQLKNQDTFNYSDIPNFPTSSVSGHANRLIFGVLRGVEAVCMQGRFHGYEGYPLWKCAMPMRVMKLLGVKVVIITNAAGGVNPDYTPGDIMIIKDHINFPGFIGNNPLFGHNDERWGPRFPSMTGAYDKQLRGMCRRVALEMNMAKYLHEGTYVMLSGPTYETVAELKMLRILGADTVGMSTVHEVLTAHHCGLRVLGISLVTNACQDNYDDDSAVCHAEVLETAEKRKPDMQELVARVVQEVGTTLNGL